MNVREFREEIADAFIKGVEWSLQAPASIETINKTPGGVDTIILGEANRLATRRVLTNAAKLDPIP